MNKQTNDQAANEFVQTVSDQGSGGTGPSWRTVQGLLTAIGQETPVINARAADIDRPEALLSAASETIGALNRLIVASESNPTVAAALAEMDPSSLDAESLLTRLREATGEAGMSE